MKRIDRCTFLVTLALGTTTGFAAILSRHKVSFRVA